MTTTPSLATRLAAQSVIVLNPDTDAARRVFPTGEVETHEGIEYVVFANVHGGHSRVRELRPANQFTFCI
jgi:hypothetical protein